MLNAQLKRRGSISPATKTKLLEHPTTMAPLPWPIGDSVELEVGVADEGDVDSRVRFNTATTSVSTYSTPQPLRPEKSGCVRKGGPLQDLHTRLNPIRRITRVAIEIIQVHLDIVSLPATPKRTNRIALLAPIPQYAGEATQPL